MLAFGGSGKPPNLHCSGAAFSVVGLQNAVYGKLDSCCRIGPWFVLVHALVSIGFIQHVFVQYFAFFILFSTVFIYFV